MGNGTSDVKIEDVESDTLVEYAAVPTLAEIEKPLDSSAALSRMKAITEIIDGSVKLSLMRTRPQDWVRMSAKAPDGGKREIFYLMASGIEKIRTVWGIYYEEISVFKESMPDGSYKYHCSGVAGSNVLDRLYGKCSIQADGARSSSDPFFAARKTLVDEADVRKAAFANFQVRAVTTLLGLKNLTADDLKAFGVDVAKIPAFEFKEGTQGKSTDEEKEMRADVRKWLLEIHNNNEDVAQQALYEMSTYPEKRDGKPTGKMVPGVKSVDGLFGGRLKYVYGQVKKDYEEFDKAMGGQGK